MNPEQKLNAVEYAIEHRPHSEKKSCSIVWREGRVLCVPNCLMKANDIILWAGLSTTLERGLTIQEWNEIRDKIAKWDLKMED